MKIDPPITSITLLPFVLMLVGSWVLSRRERTSVVFALVATVCYSVILALLALLFRVTSSGEGAEITVSAAPLSAALHGLLIAGLGTLVGWWPPRGPFLPDRVRQVLRPLVAVGISVVLTMVLAMLILVLTAVSDNPMEGLRQDGGSQPGERATGRLTSPTVAAQGTRRPCGWGSWRRVRFATSERGYAVAPRARVAGGYPKCARPGRLAVGRRGAQGRDAVREFLGNWPFAGTWRLLMLAPVMGLLLGGAVAAHGAPPSHRWRYGALIAIPYTIIVLLTTILARLSVSLSASALKLDLAFGASSPGRCWSCRSPRDSGPQERCSQGEAPYPRPAALGRCRHRLRLWRLAARDFSASCVFLIGRPGTRGCTRVPVRYQGKVGRVAARL